MNEQAHNKALQSDKISAEIELPLSVALCTLK